MVKIIKSQFLLFLLFLGTFCVSSIFKKLAFFAVFRVLAILRNCGFLAVLAFLMFGAPTTDTGLNAHHKL